MYIFENKYRWLPSIQPYQTGARCWSKQKSAYRRILHGGTILLFTPPSKGFKWRSEKFLHKNERSFRWRTFSSPPKTCLLGSQKGSNKTCKPVMVSHHRPFILRKRSELQKKECFIDNNPRNTPILPSCFSLWGQSLQAWSSSPRL